MQIAASPESTTGGGRKYFQQRIKDTICTAKNIQPKAPMACGLLRANPPRYHAR